MLVVTRGKRTSTSLTPLKLGLGGRPVLQSRAKDLRRSRDQPGATAARLVHVWMASGKGNVQRRHQGGGFLLVSANKLSRCYWEQFDVIFPSFITLFLIFPSEQAKAVDLTTYFNLNLFSL